MAAVGAVNRLRAEGIRPTLYDKNSYPGGHTATFPHPTGFLFDDGPHISFTMNERIQKLFAASVDDKYETIQTRVNNYWNGHWIKHPAQCNLYGLPQDLVVDILSDFMHVKNDGHGEIRNYEEWLIASYGRTFAEVFPGEYGQKYHTTTADNMTIGTLPKADKWKRIFAIDNLPYFNYS